MRFALEEGKSECFVGRELGERESAVETGRCHGRDPGTGYRSGSG